MRLRKTEQVRSKTKNQEKAFVPGLGLAWLNLYRGSAFGTQWTSKIWDMRPNQTLLWIRQPIQTMENAEFYLAMRKPSRRFLINPTDKTSPSPILLFFLFYSNRLPWLTNSSVGRSLLHYDLFYDDEGLVCPAILWKDYDGNNETTGIPLAIWQFALRVFDVVGWPFDWINCLSRGFVCPEGNCPGSSYPVCLPLLK